MTKQSRHASSARVIPLAASLCFTILTGCGDEGDDITNVTNEISGMEKVTAFADLPKCSAENFGLIYFVADSAKVFYCDEKKWTTLNGTNGTDGKDGVDGKDGEDGTDGKDGIDGKDGVSPVLFDSAGNYIPGTGDTISVVIQKYGKVVEGLGECKDAREGEVAHLDSIEGSPYYICKSSSWQTATALEYDTYQWTDTTDGAAKIGAVSQKLYIFDKNRWRAALGAEVELGGCIEARKGEVAKYSGIYFTCKARAWEPSTLLEYDTYGMLCPENASINNGVIHPYNKYVCDGGKFRFAMPMEVAIKRGCTSYNKGESARYQYSNYVCDPDPDIGIRFSDNGKRIEKDTEEWESRWIADRDSSGWSFDFAHLNIGSIQDSRDGQVYKTVGYKTQVWMKENLRYETANSYCYHDSTKYCNYDDEKGGRYYNNNQSLTNICPEGWHVPSEIEWGYLFDYYNNFYGSLYVYFDIMSFYISSCRNAGEDMEGNPVVGWGGDYCYSGNYWSSEGNVAADFGGTARYDVWTAESNDSYTIRCVKDSEE